MLETERCEGKSGGVKLEAIGSDVISNFRFLLFEPYNPKITCGERFRRSDLATR